VHLYTRVGIVNKNKTFDKIFFDEKYKLLEMLEKYKDKTIYPPSLGLDNKLGILLYGPPGTGKTGTIFCVANWLKKPILLINSLKVKKSTIINSVNELKKTHIIVLDEFDHLLQELKIDDMCTYSGFFGNDHTQYGPDIPSSSVPKKQPSGLFKSNSGKNKTSSLKLLDDTSDDTLPNLIENENKMGV